MAERASAIVEERETTRMRITFYTAPAPFEGAEGVRQTLAIHSWLRLDCLPDVVLMGRHSSLKSFAQPLHPRVSVDSEIDITYVIDISQLFYIPFFAFSKIAGAELSRPEYLGVA